MKGMDVVSPVCCPPLTAAMDRDRAAELAETLKALADPTRLQLLSIIATAADGEVCACDFPELLGRSQSTTSHHLSQLVAAGILEREQRGKWAWFRLRGDRLAEVAAALQA
jgi:ArsR family transcriptional regulator